MRKQNLGKQAQLRAGLALRQRTKRSVNIVDKPQKQLHPFEATKASNLLHALYLLDSGNGREVPAIEGGARSPHLCRRVDTRPRPILLLRPPASVRQSQKHTSQLHLQRIKRHLANLPENMGHRLYHLSRTLSEVGSCRPLRLSLRYYLQRRQPLT